MKTFIHLRIHTEFSLTNSIIKIKSLMNKIIKLRIPASCVTDDNNVYSFIKYYNTSIISGIKPLLGCELQINYKHKIYILTFIAMNSTGYFNIFKLITLSCKSLLQKQYILKFSKGLIIMSGINKGKIGFFLISNNIKKAILLINKLIKQFKGRLYLEIQRICLQKEEYLLAKSIYVANNSKTAIVATNDVMFVQKLAYDIHKTRVLIHEDNLIKKANQKMFYNKEQYFKNPIAMIVLFKDIPEAIENSIMIAIRCNITLKKNTVYFPISYLSNSVNISKYFVLLSNKRLNHRLITTNIFKMKKVIKYKIRLYEELTIIVSMGFCDYFFIVMNFIKWAKNTSIPVGPGRGSGAGSLVAYALEITDVDPIKYDLLFERFLNPERIMMPDFDVDFCMKKRDKVIDYVTNFYGKKLVAHLVTYSAMSAKSIIRDVTRVKGKPLWLGEKISKLIPVDLGISLKRAFNKILEIRKLIENNKEAKRIWTSSLKLEGIIKGIGRHAGGIIIAPKKIINYYPLICDDEEKNIIQVDKNDVKYLGLIKFDFLGLRTLTVIYLSLYFINNSKKPTREIYNIPLNDFKSFSLLNKAETCSTFQLESQGMKELIKKIKPNNITDIIALLSLFRPGPIKSGIVDEFIKRKNGEYTNCSYFDESIKPILRSTYGLILYQEQVMRITNKLTGCSLGRADLFRRAIQKKNNIKKYRKIFVKDCVINKLKGYTALKKFEVIKKFAGYSFNKSHSTAYGLISYKTIWLKSNYPSQYMASVLSTEIYNIDKIMQNISECKRINLIVIPPNINISIYNFSVNIQKNIVYGLGAIKGVGKDLIYNLIGNRKKNGLFFNLFDFYNRIPVLNLNKRIFSALLFSGCLDNISPYRKNMLYTINTAIRITYQNKYTRIIGINKLFIYTDYKLYEYVKQNKQIALLIGEITTLGFYISFFNS
ncbi:DNA polymerase III subunit alpha [Candidatus Portiera aleyrodidarum]|uniref:DNA polymerase III subunit alpha n=1 Tax=Candidatus Portiera aleyrodidarum TaxID=91844 RepID=UPI00027E663E|nr:DNA polymerase III subunit alpha [Candidatus Portiera aleyrodidarum]AFS18898.1 DNA polymerase III subunit alpha [Candidatus Portiera aleyrodidarum BT-QVLC]